MDVSKFIQNGKDLGLSGQELKDYVTEREDKEENARREKEREERGERLQLREIEKQKLEIEKLKIESGNSNDNGAVAPALLPRSQARKPKLPPFDSQKEDIDNYLLRFERFATNQAWPEEEWASNLSALLTGDALKVYGALSSESANKYEDLKAALLKRFEYTHEGFRRKLRNARLEKGETYVQLVVRTTNYLQRWLDLSETESTFEGLKDMILREQILNSCNRELATFLRERQPKTVDEMARLADTWTDAHRTGIGSLPSTTNKFPRGQEQGAPSHKPVTVSGPSNRCFLCQKVGHIARDCRSRPMPKQKPQTKGRATSALLHNGVSAQSIPISDVTNEPVTVGMVEGTECSVMRDTGCTGVLVKKSLISESAITDKTRDCILADGTVRTFPVAVVNVRTPYYSGKVHALVVGTPTYDLIIGNIQGARDPNDADAMWNVIKDDQDEANAIVTRSQSQAERRGKPYSPLQVTPAPGLDVTRDEVKREQREDPSLKFAHELAEKGEPRVFRNGSVLYKYKDDLLYREFCPKDGSRTINQLVVPGKYRRSVLAVGHDGIMSGHLGTRKTIDRVMQSFFWPGIQSDIKRYCISCDTCQRTVPKGRCKKVPLGQQPLIEVPFERVAIDLVGPINPKTERGNRHILTVVDFATRYPEAVPLPSIEAERVAEALVDVYTRVGVPKEVLSDRGSQFTSSVFKEVNRLLSIKGLTTTPYSPQSNGLVERFNGVLKSMLKKMCMQRPTDWDRYLPAILFAYREAPQASLGFSPFELLYGRSVRGPLAILKELWTKETENPEVKTTYQYIFDLQNKLEETCRMAHDALKKSGDYQRGYQRGKSKPRNLKEGDLVLILLPTDHNKLLMHWKGPYPVTTKVGNCAYKVKIGDKEKVFHANILKPYILRESETVSNITLTSEAEIACVGVIEESEEDEDIVDGEVVVLPVTGNESYKDVSLDKSLSPERQTEVMNLLASYSDVLTDTPGETNLIEHDIRVNTPEPIRSKPYPTPFVTHEIISKEIEEMKRMGIIEPSKSPYASPVVIVKKKDGEHRFCVDYRKLNQVTVFDAEPLPNTEEIFAQLSGGEFFTKMDLCKGYWQIPLSPDAREKTAFCTQNDGLHHFRKLPFGLVSAPATFSRMMRLLLHGLEGVKNFVDDILIVAATWEEHMERLQAVLQKLREAGLTAKPSKSFVGYKEISFLGHLVGRGQMKPEPSNVSKVMKITKPKTKTQVRSLMGLISYYRKFVPNFATVTAPLTDLTRKKAPTKVIWTDACERALNTVKEKLSGPPILRLPELSQTFVIRTDASATAVGAVLMQEHQDGLFPVLYASRKLLPREQAYATVEREALALVWAIKCFQRYLYGQKFVVEVDHKPLAFLNSAKLTNSRVMRWALALQPYRYTISAIPGKDNVGADLMSRCPLQERVTED